MSWYLPLRRYLCNAYDNDDNVNVDDDYDGGGDVGCSKLHAFVMVLSVHPVSAYHNHGDLDNENGFAII